MKEHLTWRIATATGMAALLSAHTPAVAQQRPLSIPGGLEFIKDDCLLQELIVECSTSPYRGFRLGLIDTERRMAMFIEREC